MDTNNIAYLIELAEQGDDENLYHTGKDARAELKALLNKIEVLQRANIEMGAKIDTIYKLMKAGKQ